MKRYAAIILIVMIFALSGCSSGSTEAEGGKQGSTAAPTIVSTTVPSQPAEEQKAATPSPTAAVQKDNTSQSNEKTPTPTPSAQKKESFTLLITENKGNKEILNKKIEIVSKKSLMEYLKAEASVIEEGGFIKSINDISSIPASKLTSEQKKAGILGVDWFIYVNGKKTSTGAYDVFPKSGEVVNVDYKEWAYQDYGP